MSGPSDTRTPVCLDNWDQWKCLKWSFRQTDGQMVQIISLLGVLVYFCQTCFWQWWSRGWKESDIALFSSLLTNLIRDLAKAYTLGKLFFCPVEKCCFYFFHSKWKWKMPERQIAKTYFRSVKMLCFDKYALLVYFFLTFIKDWQWGCLLFDVVGLLATVLIDASLVM